MTKNDAFASTSSEENVDKKETIAKIPRKICATLIYANTNRKNISKGF